MMQLKRCDNDLSVVLGYRARLFRRVPVNRSAAKRQRSGRFIASSSDDWLGRPVVVGGRGCEKSRLCRSNRVTQDGRTCASVAIQPS